MKYNVKEAAPLLEVLALMAPDSTRTTLRSWIKEGRVSVDGEPCFQANSPIQPGQTIDLGPRPRFAGYNVQILYEDKHLVVVDKPEGLLTVATDFEEEETVHAILKAKFKPGKVYVVHRLDQDTSGVMMFARSLPAQEEIKARLEEHTIERVYYAIVEGTPPASEGTWESYQYEDGNYVVHNTEEATEGKYAQTHYKVVKKRKHYTLLEIQLSTGRKNQIRAHCQMAGCPVAGDKKYGAKTNPLKRLGLHAHFLGLFHPISGKKMQFTSPLPKVFKEFFKIT